MANTPSPIPFAERLRDLAAEAGFSQAKVAAKTPFSRSTINRLFKGRPPNTDHLEAIAAAFDISLDRLVEGTDAVNVVAEAALAPSQEEHRQALEEAAKAKSEVLILREQLETEKELRAELGSKLSEAEREKSLALEELQTAKESLIHAREHQAVTDGRMTELRAERDKWITTALGQQGHIAGLERVRDKLTADIATVTAECQRLQRLHAILAHLYQSAETGRRSSESKRRKALAQANTNANIGVGAAALTGLLGFALAAAVLE
ncbi:MAG: helix-turn-helix domain-containing protein [Myxococcales bacterium]|nr:helix-turn-helix domain-containing protein [Myxococcales bacterium]